MLWNQGGGGGGGAGVVAKTCTSGDFFSAVDGSGNFTCATPAGSGDVTAVGDCASGNCFDGTDGSTITAAPAGHLLLKSSNSMYFDADIATGSTGNGFVFRSNNTSSTLMRVIEDGYADLRSGLDIRLYDTDDSNYVQLSVPALASNFTATFPAETGTVCTTGSVCSGYQASGTYATNSFVTMNAPSGTDPVADSATDTLNFAASGIATVTGDSSTDTITIAATEVDGSTTNEIEVVDEAYSSANFNGGTTTAVSQDDLYDLIHAGDSDDDGKADILDTTTNGFVKTSGGTGAISIDTSTYLTAEVDGSTTNEIEVVDEAYSSANFNGGTTTAVSQDDFYDLMHIGDTDDDGKPNILDAASCTDGIQTASDGTISCLSASSTPEFVSRVMTAGGTLGNYAVVMADGSDDDEVIEATTSTTQILGCSQDSDGTTSTNPVEVAVSGVARCKADATVTAGSFVKLGATGEFALATAADRVWGRAVTDDDAGSASAYILLFDGAEGVVPHVVDLGADIPDLTTNTVNVTNVSPPVNISSTGMLRGFNFAPTTTSSDGGDMVGFHVAPAWTAGGNLDADDVYGFVLSGTVGVTGTSNLSSSYALMYDTAFTSATAGSVPVLVNYGFWNKPTMTTTAASSTATSTGFVSAYHNPTFVLNGSSSTWNLTEDVGLKMGGTYTKTTGTALNITTRAGVQYNEVVNTSGSLTDNVAVDVKALTVGSGVIAAMRSAITAASGRYFLYDTGGAQSAMAGELVTYDNVAKATNENGAAFTVYSASATAQGANIASTNLIASATAGRYQICSMVTITRAGTTSTMPSSTIGWTDNTDSNVKSMLVTATSAANTTGTVDSDCILADVKAATAITYSTASFASTGGTSMQYKIYITATRL